MWHILFDKILPYIIAIETPEGSGTGFLFAYNADKTLVAFATAAHVVTHADNWHQPIKLRHHLSGKEIFLTEPDRLIDIDSHRDSASILIVNKQDYWPPEALPMMDSAQVKKVGIELGWAGYPAIAVPHICLFTGRVAAFISYDDSYLIDGVAINGVSGGPVFCESLTDAFTPEIIGTISSYMSNRQRGDTLPGMLIAHDLTAFHETIKRIRSLDEYRKTKKEEDEKRRQQESAGDIPPTGPTATADPERVVQTDPTEPTKT